MVLLQDKKNLFRLYRVIEGCGRGGEDYQRSKGNFTYTAINSRRSRSRAYKQEANAVIFQKLIDLFSFNVQF